MAEDKVVPTGPQGAVRVTNDDSRTVRQSGQNPDPRDNTPTAEQVAERNRRNTEKNPADTVERTKEGIPKFGGGGTRLVALRDYWPEHQPDNEQLAKEAKDEGRPVLMHREHRVREGETFEVPNDEAMDLIETGVAKREKGDRNG